MRRADAVGGCGRRRRSDRRGDVIESQSASEFRVFDVVRPVGGDGHGLQARQERIVVQAVHLLAAVLLDQHHGLVDGRRPIRDR